MKLNGDTGITLSGYLNIARTTFSAKINGSKGAEFTQGEIGLIKKRYNLDAESVDNIFFLTEVSDKDIIEK